MTILLNKPRLPPLRALQAFDTVARLQSFKAAAEELYVTPAAVSHQIRILEESLGIKLFARENNSISLTNEGKNLYPKVQRAFDLLRSSIAEMKSSKQDKRLKVTAGPAFTSRWLAKHASQFSILHPSISIEMDASLTIFDFRKNGVDVAIRFGNKLELDNVNILPLVEEAVVPVISAKVVEKMGRPFTLDDLSKSQLIHDKSLSMVKNDSLSWSDWFEIAGVKRADASQGMYFNHGDHAIQAVIDGEGVGLVRVVLATADIKSGRLIVPFGPIIPSGLNFSIVYRKNTSKQEEIQMFIDWLVDVMRRDIQAIAQLENGEEISGLLKI